MDHAEKVAKLILEAAIPGAAMTFRCKQSKGEYDFDLHYPNGKVAAVEVTSSHVQRVTRNFKEAFMKESGSIAGVFCKRSWLITPSLGADFKRIRKEADSCLSLLESEGTLSFSPLELTSPGCSDSLRKVRDDLQLNYGNSFPPAGAVEIELDLVVAGSSYDAMTPIMAAEREYEPNRTKLGKAKKANVAERHLVVTIDQLNGDPWRAMADFPPPKEHPRLPEEITNIWLVIQTERDKFVVWSGSLSQPWQRIDLEGLPMSE